MAFVPILPPWPKAPWVYEINTRVWLRELSARLGGPITLDRVPSSEWERIAQQGFHAVWLMGVWTVGAEPIAVARTHVDLQEEYRRALPDYSIDDVIGSPYAVTRYEVSPALGGPTALEALREKLGRYSLRLILDFVPNHVACDNPLIVTHPEAFIQGNIDDLTRVPIAFFKASNGAVVAHGRDPFFPAWTDTAQVNYANPEARALMLQQLFSIAAQCDGVRCDMAMLLLPDVIKRTWGDRIGNEPVPSFWKTAIAAVMRRHPQFLFMAESYWEREWHLQQEGFQFTYDKSLYDRLRKSDAAGARQHLRGLPEFHQRCARFIENHDEPRAATAFGAARARSAAAATFCAPGMKLLHEGQLEGRRVKLPVQLARRPAEPADVEMEIFYEKLLAFMRHPAFQLGTFQCLDVNSAGWNDSTHNAMLAYLWQTPGAATRTNPVLVVINLSDNRGYGRIPLGAPLIENDKQYVFYDNFDGKRYEREGRELNWPGLYVALEGHQSHLFELHPR